MTKTIEIKADDTEIIIRSKCGSAAAALGATGRVASGAPEDLGEITAGEIQRLPTQSADKKAFKTITFSLAASQNKTASATFDIWLPGVDESDLPDPAVTIQLERKLSDPLVVTEPLALNRSQS